jgi:hypothetical protein
MIELFKNDLSESIKKILDKSKKGSIDAVIIGGNTLGGYGNFTKSVKLIAELFRDKFNFEPTVITGPKENKNWTNAYFENKSRRLHLFMPEQEENLIYHDFQPKDIDEQIKKIKDKKSNV